MQQEVGKIADLGKEDFIHLNLLRKKNYFKKRVISLYLSNNK